MYTGSPIGTTYTMSVYITTEKDGVKNLQKTSMIHMNVWVKEPEVKDEIHLGEAKIFKRLLMPRSFVKVKVIPNGSLEIGRFGGVLGFFVFS